MSLEALFIHTVCLSHLTLRYFECAKVLNIFELANNILC